MGEDRRQVALEVLDVGRGELAGAAAAVGSSR
jgi:hypothetical protein